MVQITFVEADGEAITVAAVVGESLMQAARNGGVAGVVAECGGSMICGTCHVYLDAQWFERIGGPGDLEQDLLDGALEPRPTSRLSCQIVVTPEMAGMRVEVPASQL